MYYGPGRVCATNVTASVIFILIYYLVLVLEIYFSFSFVLVFIIYANFLDCITGIGAV